MNSRDLYTYIGDLVAFIPGNLKLCLEYIDDKLIHFKDLICKLL